MGQARPRYSPQVSVFEYLSSDAKVRLDALQSSRAQLCIRRALSETRLLWSGLDDDLTISPYCGWATLEIKCDMDHSKRRIFELSHT